MYNIFKFYNSLINTFQIMSKEETNEKLNIHMTLQPKQYDLLLNLLNEKTDYDEAIVLSSIKVPVDCQFYYCKDNIELISKIEYLNTRLNRDTSIDIIIDKKKLSNIFKKKYNQKCNVIIFFDSIIMSKWFSLPFTYLEQLVDDKNRTNILINSKSDILLDNKFITITNNVNYTFRDNKNISQENDRFIKNCNLISKENTVNIINPSYLYFTNLIIPTEYEKCIYNCFIILCLMYFSTEIAIKDSNIILHIESLKNMQINISYSDVKNKVDKQSYDNIYNIMDFTQGSDDITKMSILRNIISLYMYKQNNKMDDFINICETILKSLKSNYLIYTKDKINFWFDERRKVSDYVLDKTNAITIQIQSLSKVITNSLISFIAIIVGSLIPYLSKNDITLLKYGLLVYIGIISLNYIHTSSMVIWNFINIQLDFKEYRLREKILNIDEFNDIVGNKLFRRKIQFWVCMASVTITLILIMIGILYLYKNFNIIETFFQKPTIDYNIITCSN